MVTGGELGTVAEGSGQVALKEAEATVKGSHETLRACVHRA